MSTQYRVYVTPLLSAFVYGTEMEISDYVENVAGTITSSIDSTDFAVGIITFTDVQLTCDGSDGKLGASSDSRSIFQYSRDKAKLRIVFDNGASSPPTTYRGLINDEGTAVNSDTDEFVFTILGLDSVLKNSNIPAGSVSNGMTVSQALVAILNTADIRAVLGVSVSNLNPQSNVTIDLGSHYDNLNKRDAIAELLGISNSCMFIDSNLNIIVRDRQPNFQNAIVYIYGKGDQYGREGILSIQNYNTGLQRTFNSALVTGGQAPTSVTNVASQVVSVAQSALVGSSQNLASQSLFGIRQKQLSTPAITTLATLNSIAKSYTDEFSYTKIEFQVTVATGDVAGAQLLDQVSVNYPLLVTPAGKFLPVIGITAIGDANSPLPYVKGAISIDASLGFKIIEKTEDITTYQTTLKLRQIGKTSSDGGLIVPTATKTITVADSPYQILTTDDFILINAAGGPVIAKLPSPASLPQKPYTVMKIDSSTNTGTVQPYSLETLNGNASLVLPNQNDGAQFATDQSNWFGWARTLAVPLVQSVATQSTPASGFYKFYFKSDGSLYSLNSAGLEQKIGSSGGSGVISQLPVLASSSYC